MKKKNREWVTNASFGCYAREGFNRCACGNEKLQMSCHTYEDGTRGYTMYCFECGRLLDVDGTEESLRKAWNAYNAGAAKIEYVLDSVPETITIYAKPEDDLNELVKEALMKSIRVKRISKHTVAEDRV